MKSNEITIQDFSKQFSQTFEELKQSNYGREELDEEYYKEQVKEWCEQAGFYFNSVLNYSVSFCQGDGASFECSFYPSKIESPEELEEEEKIHTMRRDFPWVYLLHQEGIFSADIIIGRGLYYHSNTMDITTDHPDEDDYEVADDEEPHLVTTGVYRGLNLQVAVTNFHKQFEAFESAFLDLCKAKANELHSQMCDEVLSWNDDEYFIDYCTCCDVELEGDLEEGDVVGWFDLSGGKVVVYQEVETLLLPKLA